MGGVQSVDPSHIRIYEQLLSIKNPATRVQMIQTILSGPEYVFSAKTTGVYSHLLNYSAHVSNGQHPPTLPYEEVAPKTLIPLIALPSSHSSSHSSSSHSSSQSYNTNMVVQKKPTNHIERMSKVNSEEKAIGYFQACLEVLGLEEEVALTEESLKKAYKKATLKNHPDKGGSEKEFEKVTRAYAYLGEILRRIHGGRTKESVVESPNVLKDSRSKEYERHVEPVRLNPKKLDLNAFNQMFEQTRIPDPEEDGYGDWLTDKNDVKAPTFSGKFNRDLFNKTFEDEAKEKSSTYIVKQPQNLLMAPSLGVELGRGKPESYTAAYDAGLTFTDLKQAYTTEANISAQVASVRVDSRNFEQYSDDRKGGKAPRPMNNSELEELQRSEQMLQKREEQRKLRAAQEDMSANSYFERMKRLVLTDNTKS